MTWETAKQQFTDSIILGLKLKDAPSPRTIVAAPPYKCNGVDFGGAVGFKIQVGKLDFIDVSMMMLKDVFEYLKQSNGVYKRQTLISLYYGRHVKNKPCYTQTIAELFVKAGLATRVSKQSIILKQELFN